MARRVRASRLGGYGRLENRRLDGSDALLPTFLTRFGGAWDRLAALSYAGLNVRKGACVTNPLSEYDSAELCER